MIDDAELVHIRNAAKYAIPVETEPHWLNIGKLYDFQRGVSPSDVLAIIADLEKVRAESQRQYDYNVEQIVKYAALEAERDSARELLRKADEWLYFVLGMVKRDNDWDGIQGLRALISKELGDVS